MNRHGMTLVELLLGLVLLALFGMAVTRTLTTSSRATARALRGLAMARLTVSVAALLREELGNSDLGEVAIAGGTTVTFGRTVGNSMVCDVRGDVVLLSGAKWMGTRWPEAGRDEAVLLTDLPSGRWSAVPIVGVGSGSCPDGSGALLLTLNVAQPAAVFARVAEPVQLRGYLSGGNGWWGLAPADGRSPIQPFAGPIAAPLQFPRLSSAGLELPFRPSFGPELVLLVPLGSP